MNTIEKNISIIENTQMFYYTYQNEQEDAKTMVHLLKTRIDNGASGTGSGFGLLLKK